MLVSSDSSIVVPYVILGLWAPDLKRGPKEAVTNHANIGMPFKKTKIIYME